MTQTEAVQIAFTRSFLDVLATGPDECQRLGASERTAGVVQSIAAAFAAIEGKQISHQEAWRRDADLVLCGDDDTSEHWWTAPLLPDDEASEAASEAGKELFELASGSSLVDVLRDLSVAFMEDRSNLVLEIVYEQPRPLK